MEIKILVCIDRSRERAVFLIRAEWALRKVVSSPTPRYAKISLPVALELVRTVATSAVWCCTVRCCASYATLV